MDEEPSSTLRAHPDASVAVAAGMVRDGEADAFFSAGTRAPRWRWLLRMGRLEGCRRPAIATCYLPFARLATRRRGHRLLQAAGPLEFRYSWRCARETLLRVGGGSAHRTHQCRRGAEEGNDLAKEAYRLMDESDIRFVGNVEGRHP